MTASIEASHGEAIRALLALFPGAEAALIGAAALQIHIGKQWRHTNDVDLAVVVATDEAFARLRAAPGWRARKAVEHKWIAPNAVQVDVIPAGLEDLERGFVEWRSGARMNLIGLRLALEDPIADPSLLGVERVEAHLHIASAPTLFVLKMAAFLDRPSDREKDLEDLGHLLNEYPPHGELFFSDEMLLLQLLEPCARALLVAREIAARVNEAERALVEAFVRDVWRSDRDPLSRHRAWSFRSDDERDEVLRAFERGLSR